MATCKRTTKTVSLRQRAALTLSQLARVAAVMRESGEVLQKAPWLKVLANILSSFPEATMDERKGRRPPVAFGLSESTLNLAARRCGLGATREEIERQFLETAAWRFKESRRTGVESYAAMKSDKIGELLGITDVVRAEAAAWNIGTFGGSKQARATAARERDRAYQRARRADKGARSQEEVAALSLTKRKPWQAEGISRATWYRRREAEAAQAEKSAENDVRQPRLRQPRRGQIRASETTASGTNIQKGLPPFRIHQPPKSGPSPAGKPATGDNRPKVRGNRRIKGAFEKAGPQDSGNASGVREADRKARRGSCYSESQRKLRSRGTAIVLTRTDAQARLRELRIDIANAWAEGSA